MSTDPKETKDSLSATGSESPDTSSPDAEPSPDSLTPEEQMERFAQDQKENDWGHQPC